ncbi:MAG: histidine phosphatase family protein [Candidatus Nanoarchaeia archaeon]|nr:histidine phosphatase family protein [Candidatus Nanoarchaeia archaeon]
MIVFVARHGKTDSNKNGVLFNGTIDDDINEEGILQAKKLGSFLSNEKIDIIYSSPMKRTKHTAKIVKSFLKNNSKIVYDTRLRECNFGIFEGKTKEYIMKHYLDMYNEKLENKFQFILPSGESYKMVYNRIYEFINEIYNSNKNILIVTHATTLKLVLLLLTDYKLEYIEKQHYLNTALFKFEVSKLNDSIISKTLIFNQDDHLLLNN